MRSKVKWLGWTVALACMAIASFAWPAQHALAANNQTCTVDTVALAFGSFDVYTAPASVSTSLTGTCRKGNGQAPATIAVTLSDGNHIQGSGNRAMGCTTCTGSFTGDLLQYQLYEDASLTTIWSSSVTVNITNPCPCGNTDTAFGPITLYGKIFTAVAGGINDSSVGSYTDSITETLNF